jgi:hypothetical protein
MADNALQPEQWERQTGEPNIWFARFESYRLAGPSRSIHGVLRSEKGAKGNKRRQSIPGAWSRAATRWRWRERAEAWDELERHKAREAHAQGIAEMNQRHVQESQALQSKAVQRLKTLELDDLSATDVVRFLVEASKLERTARGEPESIQEKRHAGPGGGQLKITLEDAVAAIKELEEWEQANLPVERDGNG